MNTGIFAVLFIALCVFAVLLAIAWVVNKILGRPSVNGAAIFFWLLLAANVAMHVYAITSPKVTSYGAYHAGKTTGYSLPLLVVAFFMARGFKKRKVRYAKEHPTGPNGKLLPADAISGSGI